MTTFFVQVCKDLEDEIIREGGRKMESLNSIWDSERQVFMNAFRVERRNVLKFSILAATRGLYYFQIPDTDIPYPGL